MKKPLILERSEFKNFVTVALPLIMRQVRDEFSHLETIQVGLSRDAVQYAVISAKPVNGTFTNNEELAEINAVEVAINKRLDILHELLFKYPDETQKAIEAAESTKDFLVAIMARMNQRYELTKHFHDN